MRIATLAAVLALVCTAAQAQAPSTGIARPAPARSSATGATPAPGGGPGMVWVNSRSKVYHCQGDRYYGNTKQGSYMSEVAAKSAGDRPDHGKACS